MLCHCHFTEGLFQQILAHVKQIDLKAKTHIFCQRFDISRFLYEGVSYVGLILVILCVFY